MTRKEMVQSYIELEKEVQSFWNDYSDILEEEDNRYYHCSFDCFELDEDELTIHWIQRWQYGDSGSYSFPMEDFYNWKANSKQED